MPTTRSPTRDGSVLMVPSAGEWMVVFESASSTFVCRSGLVIDSVWTVADLACGGRLSVKIWTSAFGTPAA